jgi:response regulator RpfG family c-di-GMP phosphodiesterase
MTTPPAQILLVDDEPHILDGLRRMLRDEFLIETAADPVMALERLRDGGPCAVILSDFQMPRMNGAEFLAAARELNPDTSRILLTGQADLAGAASVVNSGGILRLLLKPASRTEVTSALHAGVAAFRATRAERELLDDTLRGSVRALTEVLALANPLAFDRSTRLRNLVAALLKAADLELSWHIEMAALLADIGAVALPTAVLERLENGQPLTVAEQELVDRLPTVADQILGGIPRIDQVRHAILDQLEDYEPAPDDTARLGSDVLRVARDFDSLIGKGADAIGALAAMREQRRRYNSVLLDALAEVVAADEDRSPRAVGVGDLRPGMVLAEDAFTNAGLKLVPKGNHLTVSMIARLENYAAMESGIAEPLHVFVGNVGVGAL